MSELVSASSDLRSNRNLGKIVCGQCSQSSTHVVRGRRRTPHRDANGRRVRRRFRHKEGVSS